VLASAGPITGQVQVSSGTLLVNDAIGAPGGVTVSAGATLSGTGSVEGAVTLNAGAALNLAGNGVGPLTLGGLTANGATLRFDVAAEAADSVALGSGTLTVGDSGSVISLAISGVVAGKSFTLMTFTNGAAPVGLHLDAASAAVATLTVTETSVSVAMNAAD